MTRAFASTARARDLIGSAPTNEARMIQVKMIASLFLLALPLACSHDRDTNTPQGATGSDMSNSTATGSDMSSGSTTDGTGTGMGANGSGTDAATGGTTGMGSGSTSGTSGTTGSGTTGSGTGSGTTGTGTGSGTTGTGTGSSGH